jgi:hypothetical protein
MLSWPAPLVVEWWVGALVGHKEGGLVVGSSVSVALGAKVDSLVGHWMVRWLEGHLGYS